MKYFLLLLMVTLAGLHASGQVIEQERIYLSGPAYKYIRSSTIDRNGHVLLSGLAQKSGILNPHDNYLLLLKPNSDTLWTRKGPEVKNAYVYAGVRTRINGGFALATEVVNPTTPANNNDVVLYKISHSGAFLMNKVIDPSANSNGLTDFLTLPDKGYLINSRERLGSASNVFFLSRTDSLGNLIWHRNLTPLAADGLNYMQRASQNRIIMAGTVSNSNPAATTKIKLMLLNANGDTLKTNTPVLARPGISTHMEHVHNHDLRSLSDGGFLITGLVDTIGTSGPLHPMGMVAKVDQNLRLVWQYVYRSSQSDIINFYKARELTDGSFLVLGNQSSMSGFQLFHLSATGSVLNIYQITTNISICHQLVVTTMEAMPDDSYIFGGECIAGASSNFYVAKVKIPGMPPAVPESVALGTKAEVILQPALLGQVYPNPAQSEAVISYDLPGYTKSARIVITTITGQEAGNYSLKSGVDQGSVVIDVSRLQSGLYLYTLIVDGRPVATRKLAIVK